MKDVGANGVEHVAGGLGGAVLGEDLGVGGVNFAVAVRVGLDVVPLDGEARGVGENGGVGVVGLRHGVGDQFVAKGGGKPDGFEVDGAFAEGVGETEGCANVLLIELSWC